MMTNVPLTLSPYAIANPRAFSYVMDSRPTAHLAAIPSTLSPSEVVDLGIRSYKENVAGAYVAHEVYKVLKKWIPYIRDRVHRTELEPFGKEVWNRVKEVEECFPSDEERKKWFLAVPTVSTFVLSAKQPHTMDYIRQHVDEIVKEHADRWKEITSSKATQDSRKSQETILWFQFGCVNSAWLLMDQASHHGLTQSDQRKLSREISEATEEAMVQWVDTQK